MSPVQSSRFQIMLWRFAVRIHYTTCNLHLSIFPLISTISEIHHIGQKPIWNQIEPGFSFRVFDFNMFVTL